MACLEIVQGMKQKTFYHHRIKECNMITDQHFWLAYHNDWSRWFDISSAPLFAVAVSVLWVGLQKSK